MDPTVDINIVNLDKENNGVKAFVRESIHFQRKRSQQPTKISVPRPELYWKMQ